MGTADGGADELVEGGRQEGEEERGEPERAGAEAGEDFAAEGRADHEGGWRKDIVKTPM